MERNEIEAIVRRAKVCRLAMADGGRPYVVPLVFGHEDGALYFHSSPTGRKIEMLRANGSVCFEIDVDVEVVPRQEACRWGCRFRSVVGFGTASFLEGRQEKARALNVIMRQQSGRDWELDEAKVDRVAVIRVEIEQMTGRQAGY